MYKSLNFTLHIERFLSFLDVLYILFTKFCVSSSSLNLRGNFDVFYTCWKRKHEETAKFDSDETREIYRFIN